MIIYVCVHIYAHKSQVTEIWLDSTYFKSYLILFDDSMMALAGPFGIGNRSCIVAAIGKRIYSLRWIVFWSLLGWDHAKIVETCWTNSPNTSRWKTCLAQGRLITMSLDLLRWTFKPTSLSSRRPRGQNGVTKPFDLNCKCEGSGRWKPSGNLSGQNFAEHKQGWTLETGQLEEFERQAWHVVQDPLFSAWNPEPEMTSSARYSRFSRWGGHCTLWPRHSKRRIVERGREIKIDKQCEA